jgi:hypothetical protein
LFHVKPRLYHDVRRFAVHFDAIAASKTATVTSAPPPAQK